MNEKTGGAVIVLVALLGILALIGYGKVAAFFS
jgi:hypothetical protein